MVAFVVLLLYVVIVPLASPYDPNNVDFSLAYQSPSLHHPFGTDEFGRDLFVRTALGGRISIGIGFAATIAIMVVGILYGAISGFVGGWLDNALMRFLDALYGLPYLPSRSSRSRSSASSTSGRWSSPLPSHRGSRRRGSCVDRSSR